MNQQIVEYLNVNKEHYTQESLVAQLRAAGHAEADIVAAVASAYGGTHVQDSLPPIADGAVVKYAGFWIRFVAAFIDGFIISIVTLPIGFVLGFFAVGEQAGIGAAVLGNVLPFILTWTYYVLMTHKYQATIGKKAVGIEVRAKDAIGKVALGNVVLRETIGKLVSIFTLYIGYIMAGFMPQKRALHDLIGGTVVVYGDPSKGKNKAVIIVVIIIAIFAVIAIIGILASISLVSLNAARVKAQEASFKSSVMSTVPAAIICMDDGADIVSPKENAKICYGLEDEGDYTWPMLVEGGQWGELSDGDVSDGTFAYTAYFVPSDLRAQCTELGCDFLGDVNEE